MHLSYWEKRTWLSQVDICIIGSGIVGLNAALYLKTLQPRLKILVLERGLLPSGASTKNAGFACFGSLSEIFSDLKSSDYDSVLSLMERRWRGLQLLRQLLGDDVIKLELKGGYELFTPEQESLYGDCVNLMDKLNSDLKSIIGNDTVYRLADNMISEFGFGSVQHLVWNSAEGQIDTGSMMSALIRKVHALGVECLCGTEVMDLQQGEGGVEINTRQFGRILANKVIVATNGFARQFFPQLQVNPARAQVLVTSPIPDLKIKGTFHYEEGYYYFRDIDNRVLLGGGRNLDIEGETTYDQSTSERIQARLDQLLSDVILPDTPFTVEQRWAGTMGVGPVKEPIIEFVSKDILCAVRMGGMGVALGSEAGRIAAEMLL